MYVKNYCVMSSADNRLFFAQKCLRSKQNVGKRADQHSALSLLTEHTANCLSVTVLHVPTVFFNEACLLLGKMTEV